MSDLSTPRVCSAKTIKPGDDTRRRIRAGPCPMNGAHNIVEQCAFVHVGLVNHGMSTLSMFKSNMSLLVLN